MKEIRSASSVNFGKQQSLTVKNLTNYNIVDKPAFVRPSKNDLHLNEKITSDKFIKSMKWDANSPRFKQAMFNLRVEPEDIKFISYFQFALSEED